MSETISAPDPTGQREPAPNPQPDPSRKTFGALLGGWPTLAFAVLFGLGVFVWFQWDGIVDRITSVEAMQRRVAISVGSPAVHTRERLLNDRYEQVAWLERELMQTNPVTPPVATKPDAASSSSPGQPLDAEASNRTLSASNLVDLQTRYGFGDPRQAFEVMNGFRDLLRAERARAMLDDRHDIDNNTLDLLSFDTTVMPRSDVARGYAAIEALLTREPKDLLPGVAGLPGALKRFKEQRNTDLFDTYVGWLERARNLQRSNLKSLTQTLDTADIATSNGDYESILRVNACSELLRVSSAQQTTLGQRRGPAA